jgi:glutamyl endopeptidase
MGSFGSGQHRFDVSDRADPLLEAWTGQEPVVRFAASRTIFPELQEASGRGPVEGLGTLRPADVAGGRGTWESVLWSDQRRRVLRTEVFPWSAICHLEVLFPSGAVVTGTGAVIGPATVLTAGHCVYDHRFGGFAQAARVAPGRNGTLCPFGTVTADRFTAVAGWMEQLDDRCDYGAIFLAEPVGHRTGWFGIGCLMGSNLENLLVNSAGYPLDLPVEEPLLRGKTLWWTYAQIAAVDEHRLWYSFDTYQGQSGSPVWYYEPSTKQRYIVGIHTTGWGTVNSACRVSREILNNLKEWREVLPAQTEIA